MVHAEVSRNEVDEEFFKGLICVCNVLYSKCGISAYTASVLRQISHIVERAGSEKSQLAANLLQLVQKLNTNGAAKDGPSWKPKSPFLSCLTEFRCFHDYIVLTLQRSPSVSTASVVLRDAWCHDRLVTFRPETLPSPELVETLLSMGANPHIERIDNKCQTSSEEPLVSNDTTFTHLLKYAVMGVFLSAYTGGNFAIFILKVVLSMAATCPELEAPTLAILKVCEDGMVEMVRLEYWASAPTASAQCFYVFLKVKLSFLISFLISNLEHHVDDNEVTFQVEWMMSQLKLSTPIVQCIMSGGQEQRRFVAERVLYRRIAMGL